MQNTPHKPIGLYLAVALAVLAIVAAALAWLIWQFTLLPPIVALALRIAVFALPLAGASWAGAVGIIALYRRWATHEYIRAEHVTRLTVAQSQRFPAGLHSLSFHDSSKQLALPSDDKVLALPAPEPPSIPSLAMLLDQGKIGPGRPLVLGFRSDDGTPIEGDWNSLYSCGIGALQGAGKSWLAAFLLAQSAAQGGRLIVCDLHYGNPESLASRIEALSPAFMCDIASTPDAILSALKLASDKLQQRIGGRGGSWPIVVAIDEWTSLLRTKVGDVLPGYLEDISEQGRKFNVNALLSAQGWTKDTAGVVRNRLTSHYVLRQRPDEARYQLGLGAGQLPLDVRLLPDATGYLLDVRGNLTKIVIPHMTASDLARVGALIDRPALATGQPFGFQRATAPLPVIAAEARGKHVGSTVAQPASTATERIKPASPEALRAAALFRQNMSERAIIRELRGVTGGRNYGEIQDEVRRLIVEGMSSSEET